MAAAAAAVGGVDPRMGDRVHQWEQLVKICVDLHASPAGDGGHGTSPTAFADVIQGNVHESVSGKQGIHLCRAAWRKRRKSLVSIHGHLYDGKDECIIDYSKKQKDEKDTKKRKASSGSKGTQLPHNQICVTFVSSSKATNTKGKTKMLFTHIVAKFFAAEDTYLDTLDAQHKAEVEAEITKHGLSVNVDYSVGLITRRDHTLSHLCHQISCCKSAHLVYERHRYNQSRNFCPSQAECVHDPKCLGRHQMLSNAANPEYLATLK